MCVFSLNSSYFFQDHKYVSLDFCHTFALFCLRAGEEVLVLFLVPFVLSSENIWLKILVPRILRLSGSTEASLDLVSLGLPLFFGFSSGSTEASLDLVRLGLPLFLGFSSLEEEDEEGDADLDLLLLPVSEFITEDSLLLEFAEVSSFEELEEGEGDGDLDGLFLSGLFKMGI